MKKFSIYCVVFCLIVLGLCKGDENNADVKRTENRDWQKYIGDGKNNYEMKMRANQAIADLKERLDSVLKNIKEKLDDNGVALVEQNKKDWLKYSSSRATMESNQYAGGTHAGLAHGCMLVKLYELRIADMIAYEKEIGGF